MKVILDIDQSILSDIKLYCDIQKLDMSNFISELFIKNVKEPNQLIFETLQVSPKELDLFRKLLSTYLTEIIDDLKDMKEESYQYDQQMAKVFTEFRDNMLTQDRTIAQLFQTFLKNQ